MSSSVAQGSDASASAGGYDDVHVASESAVISAACTLGCDKSDWLKLGVQLLQRPEREVRDLFPNWNESQTNSDKVETIIKKWKEKDGSKATIGKLREAFVIVNKEGAFDQKVEKKPEEMVTVDVVKVARSLGCQGNNWVNIGMHLLKRSDADVRDIFTHSTADEMKNSEKVRVIIKEWLNRGGTKATVGKLRAAFSVVEKCGRFDEMLDDILGLR